MKLWVRSLLNTPIPQSPTTPATASSKPTTALRRQRGIAEQLAQGAGLVGRFSGGDGRLPGVRLAELLDDDYRQERGQTPTENIHRQ